MKKLKSAWKSYVNHTLFCVEDVRKMQKQPDFAGLALYEKNSLLYNGRSGGLKAQAAIKVIE